MMKIAVGSDNFYKMVTEGAMVVDKTKFIQEIIEDGSEVLLFTRARRWGKTLAMRMVEAFFSSRVDGQLTKGLFDKFTIAKIESGKYMQEQGKYPVIFISFKDVQGNNLEEYQEKISFLVKSTFDKFSRELINSDKLTYGVKNNFKKILEEDKPTTTLIQESLKILSHALYQHYDNQRVYILIDEYDKPLNAAYKTPYFNQLSDLMRGILGAALKSNDYLKKGIMTGILRISKGEMLSSLNNLNEYSLLDSEFASHFGFTDNEVTDLFKQAQINIDENQVKEWFNGYKIGDVIVYNPWSIMKCLQEKGKLQAYWVNTADDSLIKDSLTGASADIKEQLATLMQSKSIQTTVNKYITFENIGQDETSFWSLLLFAGYLRVDKSEYDQSCNLYNCTLNIPNKEILSLYKGMMISWFAERLGGEAKYRLFIKKLLDGNADEFGKDLGEYLLRCTSFYDMARQPEAFYHGFVLALLAGIQEDYIISSNKESGLGRYDVMLFPKPHIKKDLGIILEFKHTKEIEDAEEVAKAALEQIDKNFYDTEMRKQDNVKKVLKMGLAFKDKSVIYAFKTTQISQNKIIESEIKYSQELKLAEAVFKDTKEKSEKPKKKITVIDSEDAEEDARARKKQKKEDKSSLSFFATPDSNLKNEKKKTEKIKLSETKLPKQTGPTG